MALTKETQNKVIREQNIPEELKQLQNWTLWKYEDNPKGGKPRKVPYFGGSTKASSNNPATWLKFSELQNFLAGGHYDGINIIFTNDDIYIGIDLDSVINEQGEISTLAQKIIELCDSYTEISPSGTGIRIIVKVSNEVVIDNRNDSFSGIEIYQRDHFLSITGNLLDPSKNTIEYRDEAVLKIVQEYLHPSAKEQYEAIPAEELSKLKTTASNAEILDRMYSSKFGDEYRYLFEIGYPSGSNKSGEDWKLACELIYQCLGDVGKAKELISMSALYHDRDKEKWETPRRGYGTYTDMTLYFALCRKKKDIDKQLAKMNTIPIGENEAFVFPYGYVSENGLLYKIVEKRVAGGGIEQNKVMICRQTPIITRSFMNVEHPQLYHEISWIDNGKTHSEIVPAGDLAIKKELLKLSYKSFAVTDNNAKELIDYFDKLNMVNQNNREYLVERIGHVKSTFVHPLRNSGIKILPNDDGEKQMLKHFQMKGTAESWVQHVLQPIKRHPAALLMVLASFTSVILKDLKLQPFIVDLSGQTSKGKTTVLHACASVWGAEGLISEWNTTKVSLERKAAFLNSFPAIYDDTRKADPKQLQSVVYNFSGGRSKGRGSVIGSQTESTWNNILLSTGEASLVDYAESAGGVAARVLAIADAPFEGIDYKFFSNLYMAIDENHGEIGLKFVEEWYTQKKELLPLFNDYNAIFQEKSQGNEVVSRIARNFAAIVFTGHLLNNFFGCEINLDLLHEIFEKMMTENKAIDKPLQFMELMLSDLDSQRDSISGRYEARGGLKAIYKNGTLFVLPAYLKQFLKVEEKAIRSEWLRREMTLGTTKSGKTTDTKNEWHHNKNNRVVPISPAIVEQLGFNFEETERKTNYP